MTNKRLDAIKEQHKLRIEYGVAGVFDEDIAYLLSLVEKQRETLLALKHQSHHTIEEEMWRIDEALKCDEGGEVGE